MTATTAATANAGTTTTTNRLDKLVVQLTRKFTINTGGSGTNGTDGREQRLSLPIDAASEDAGQQLAQEFMKVQYLSHQHQQQPPPPVSTLQQQQLFQALSNANLHPAVPISFFHTVHEILLTTCTTDPLTQLPIPEQSILMISMKMQQLNETLGMWLLQLEQLIVQQQQQQQQQNGCANNCNIILNACIQAYATSLRTTLYFHTLSNSMDHQYVMILQRSIQNMWKRFQLEKTCWMVTRQVIISTILTSSSSSSSSIPQKQLKNTSSTTTTTVLHMIPIVASVLACTILNASVSMVDKIRIQQHYHWTVCHHGVMLAQKQIWLQLLLALLDLYTTTTDWSKDYQIQSLAEQMWMHWIQSTMISSSSPPSPSPLEWTENKVWQGLLLRFIWKARYQPHAVLIEAATMEMSFSTIEVWRWASHCLATSIDRDIVFQILVSKCTRKNLSSCAIIHHIIQTTACICAHSPRNRDTAMSAMRQLQESKCFSTTLSDRDLMQLFGLDAYKDNSNNNNNNNNNITESFTINDLANIRDFSKTNFTTRQQTGALLFGISLLDREAVFESEHGDPFGFLQGLLKSYTHLSIPLLSVIMERMHQVTYLKDGVALIRYLEFLCGTIVQNSHCAQEIWNFVGMEWMQSHSPLPLRIALVRLYPKLVAGHKRLYRRVVEVLANLCGSSATHISLRLAVAATIADLAEQDNIRDVSDVIGWLQSFLTVNQDSPAQHLLVHYALLSLHYLIVSEELDFNVVVKVLNKKLCPLTDCEAILKQPLVAIEALVLVLGDGECSRDSDDSDNNDNDDKNGETPPKKLVSPQVSASIRTLLFIGKAIRGFPVNDDSSRKTIIRIRQNVITSLSKYSLAVLGVNEDEIRAAIPQPDLHNDTTGPSRTIIENQYTNLRDLVVAEMKDLPIDSVVGKTVCALEALTKRLINIEEEVLGVSLWQKRGRKANSEIECESSQNITSSLNTLPSFEIQTILPKSSSIQDMAADIPSPATSIALLLSTDGTEMLTLREHADSSLEITDPILFMFCIQGFLHSISQIIQRHRSIDAIFSEIESWNESHSTDDSMLLALSCTAASIPNDINNRAAMVRNIYDIVVKKGFNDFEKEGLATICVGLVGIACLRTSQWKMVSSCIGLLQRSIRGYGAKATFEAYYALSMIAQACHEYNIGNPKQSLKEIKDWICDISAFIFEELTTCFSGETTLLASLIACTKAGKVSPELVRSIVDHDADSIKMIKAKREVARTLFLSCAVCLPALASVNTALLLAVFRFLDTLEVGCGKGLAVSSVLYACQCTGVLDTELEEKLYIRYLSLFQENLKNTDSALDALEDLYFILKATKWNVALKKEYQLPRGDSHLFDDEGFQRSLVAALMSIALLSSVGTTNITILSRLADSVDDEDITTVIDLVCEAIALKDDSKACATGQIVMGILSAITYQDPMDEEDVEAAQNMTDSVTNAPPTTASDNSMIKIDWQLLPSPHIGTVLDGVRDTLAMILHEISDKPEAELLISRCLLSISEISIPDKYATTLVESLLLNNLGRSAAIKMLLSQVSMRRRAFSDGHNYQKLASKIFMASSDQWIRWLGEPSNEIVLVQLFPEVLPKLSEEYFEKCIKNIWERCRNSTNLDLIHCFITSIYRLLCNSFLSPKSISIVRVFCRVDIFHDIRAKHLGNASIAYPGASSICGTFVQCVKEIPLSVLDEADFFSYEGGGPRNHGEQIFLTLFVLALVDQNYFGHDNRSLTELNKIGSWLSRSLVETSIAPEQINVFQHVFKAFALGTMNELSTVKHERISSILEVALLTDKENSQIVWMWFAFVLSYWCEGGDDDTNGDLSVSYLLNVEAKAMCPLDILLDDLPYKVAFYSRREKASSLLANQLHRVLKRWTELCVNEKTLESVRRSIFACQINPLNQDAFLSLAISTLQRNIRI